MYFVFNTNEATGYLFKSRFRWLAKVIAHIVGAPYDYSTRPMSVEEFNRLTLDANGLA